MNRGAVIKKLAGVQNAASFHLYPHSGEDRDSPTISPQVKEAPKEHFQRLWMLARRETYILLPERILTELLKLFSLSRATTRTEVKSTLGRALHI